MSVISPRALRRTEADLAFFAPWSGPALAGKRETTGGAETQMLMLARGLSERGLRVLLVAFAVSEPLPRELDGIRIVVVGGRLRRFLPLRKLERALRVCVALLRLRAAVIVQRIPGPETGLVALIAKLTSRRFIYSSANVVDFSYEALEPGWLSLRLFHLGTRLADTIVVQTHEQVELCRRRFGREPILIRSIAQPAPARDITPESFLWVGRTDWYKHPEQYLALARALPEARFRMIAMPMNEDGRRRVMSIEREAAGLANLELLPPRSREALARLIPSAVAIVNTSEYEGMPNVLLEGWAQGVPSLCLNYDPDGVVRREGLGGFAEGSFERFAALARGLWEGRGEQRAVSERCRRYIAVHHSPDAVLERWEEAVAGR